ncbi:MAG: DUF4347 domain-containing protein, partial [Mycobacterium sp.]|nr:DUF4347 domain-containing protein [Mycobacterium sp.]
MSRRLPELVFIDIAVPDIGVLAAGLRPEVVPFVLEPEIPALSQIADVSVEFGQISAVHVIAHGEPGIVAFSSGPISSETIASNRPAFQKISQALGGTGQLLLWSCESGQGARGAALVSALTNATGAQVAAATGRVGSAAQGGRWQLDVRPADMRTSLPLTGQGAAGYPAVMQITKAKLSSITTDTGSSSTDFITDDQSLVLNGTVTGKTGNVLY